MGDVMIKSQNEIIVDDSKYAVNPEALIMKAIEKGMPVETMERLLAMRKELKQEYAQEKFFISLSGFQKECPTIQKKKEVLSNGKHRYNFAPLDDIVSQSKELLEKYGFSYTIKTFQENNSVKAICFAHHTAGHSEETAFTIPIDHEAYMNEAQKVASALTYAKRYAFCNAFGIMTGDEDNDGNSEPEQKKPDTNPAQKNIQNVTKTFNGKIIHTKKELDDLFFQFAKYMQENEGILSDDEKKTAAIFFNLHKQGKADFEKTNNFFTLIKKSVDGMDKAIDSAIDEANKFIPDIIPDDELPDFMKEI